jgi:hypothetical protein
MGALPQVLEIIFEGQRKNNNEKITKKNKSFFNLENTFFSFFFFCLDPSSFQTS